MRKKHPTARSAWIAAVAAVAIGGAAFAVQIPNKYQDGAGWGPHALPGDVLPPFGVPDASDHLPPYPQLPPGASPTSMHGPWNRSHPESTAAGPSLALSIAGAKAAIAKCESMNQLGAVAVVDVAGDIRAALSVDGADGSHIFVAARKALTALVFDRPSIEVMENAQKGDPDTLRRITPAMFVQFGAYPLKAHGKTIGALGYSGGIDEACSKAGAEYIQARLPN